MSLNCETRNTTVADVTWYKDDEPLPAQRYTSRNTISIKEMSADDYGVYECKAQNALGVTSRKITVVNGKEDINKTYFPVQTDNLFSMHVNVYKCRAFV